MLLVPDILILLISVLWNGNQGAEGRRGYFKGKELNVYYLKRSVDPNEAYFKPSHLNFS